jgi:hypothetical protein
VSNSRRQFLKTGLLAALFAAVPLRHVLGQSWKDRDANPGDAPLAQSDPLANYSKASFTSYLNSIFQLQTRAGLVAVTLTSVEDMPASRGGECFTLQFRGGSRALLQDTYVIIHPSLGTFALFLVPTGSDANGAQGYLATINRLSPADALNMPGPSKAVRSTPTSTSSPETFTSTPAVTPNVTPAVTPPASSTAPSTNAPASKPRKHRTRKPSWKDNDGRGLL